MKTLLKTVGVLALAFWSVSAQSAWAYNRHKLGHHHTAAMAQAQDLGEVEKGHQFHIAVSLPLRNEGDLRQLIKDLYDPHSASYRHYLKPDQFAAQYGPSQEDVQSVVNYMTVNGFTVSKIHSNHVIVDIDGDNDAVEKAFHVRVHRYQKQDGTTFYGPNDDPSVDLDTPINDIAGIDDFHKPRHSGFKLAKTNLATGGSVAPIDLRNAYAGNVASLGNGQHVALVEFSNYSESDLAPYQAAAVTYSSQAANVYASFGPIVNNYMGDLTPSSTYTTDDQEAIIQDIENIEAVAPMATLEVYMNETADNILNQIAIDDTCSQITTSALYSTSGAAYLQFAAQGQAAFNSAGDWFAYGNAANNVNGNDTNPNDYAEMDLNYEDATIVGGTQLTMNGSTYGGEVVWNQGNAATGGGILTTVAIPSYQTWINMSTNGGSTTNRNAPDVAACGYNIWIYTNGSWAGWGGTSSSTPLWAAYYALVNQQAAQANVPAIGWANPPLYAIAQNATKYAADFHDITSGNNGGYTAVAGYDLCTGLGSPNGQSLINDLVGIAQQTATVQATQSKTATPTATSTATASATPTKTNTPATTFTATFTYTVTFTPTQGQSGNCAGLPTWTTVGMPLYNAGTLVVYQGNEYKALVTTYGLDAYTPGSTPTVWQLIGPCGSSNTSTPTATTANTSTFTATSTATSTATLTWTSTATATSTNTLTATRTNTPGNTATFTWTATMTPTSTFTSTYTASSTKTPTPVVTNTFTGTPTATFTATNSATATWTATRTNTPLNTATAISTATATRTNTAANTATPTATFTRTNTPANTATPTATATSGGACAGLPTWTSVGMPLYQAGTLVVYQGNEYKALVTTYGLDAYTPGSTPTVWQLIGTCMGTSISSSTVLKTAVASNNISKGYEPVKFTVQLNQPAQVDVTLYTTMGQEVYDHTFYGNQGSNDWLWTLENKTNNLVASGLYIYTIKVKANGAIEVKTGKVLIIH